MSRRGRLVYAVIIAVTVLAGWWFFGWGFAFQVLLGLMVVNVFGYILYMIFWLTAWLSLPTATVEVAGHTVKFKYMRFLNGHYMNLQDEVHTSTGNWLIVLDLSESFAGEVAETPALYGNVRGKLILKERSFDLSMARDRAQCACGLCWTGTIYVGVIDVVEENFRWYGAVTLVLLDEEDGGDGNDRVKKNKVHLKLNPTAVSI